MIDFDSTTYKAAKGLIDAQRKNNVDWEEIISLSFLGDFDDNTKQKLLSSFVAGIDKQEWEEIVKNEKSEFENGITSSISLGNIMIPNTKDFDYQLDESYGSAWMSYNRTLAHNNFSDETRHSIQMSSHRILNKLSLDTRVSGPTKGLVIGNVQSGKTANMAALMAMAADQGWNFFIILSGTIENLRIQTQDRLINDLKSENVSWIPIDNVNTNPSFIYSLSKLNLDEKSKNRYLMVCLKNSTRLQNFLNWAKKDLKNREKLKILFIDDEADQAGVNAAKEGPSKDNPDEIERTKINKLIVNLLTNKDGDGNEVATQFKSLNYVAYTATPYANILNEKPGKDSIYPSSFVSCLSVSNSYFGPQRIFGLEGTDEFDGLNIINPIIDDEVKSIKLICKEKKEELPDGLKDAIYWFYVCFAIRRFNNSKKPVSMLIHTSQKQVDHETISNNIKKWIGELDEKEFIKGCQKSYIEQTSKFSLSKFREQFPDYSERKVMDYPKFSDISDELVKIYQSGLKTIKIDEDGDFKFSKGVHLCIDNCAHNYVEGSNEHIRLIYPKKEIDYATGFIVVGGATLSRGLTIEGLVSTYFLRGVKQADTLMQMGRWFGYRPGYELLPRIWMTDKTKDQFKFLSVLDYELRKEMEYMEEYGISPSLVGIKVRNYPRRSFLEISSKNKTKAAVQVQMDFTGISTQTTIFHSDEEKLKNNFENTVEFINSMSDPIDISNRVKSENSILWENISNEKVIDYISKLEYPKNDITFIDVKLFKSWYEKIASKNGLTKWNVLFAGVEHAEENDFINMGRYKICTVSRSRKKGQFDDGYIRIGALRAPKDLYIDIDIENSNLSEKEIKEINRSSTSKYKYIRKVAGLDDTSLLIIYAINKNSQPRQNEKNRECMNTKTDVIGLMVVIPPNNNTQSGSYVSIDLSNENTRIAEVDIDA